MAPFSRRNGHHCPACSNEDSIQDADIAALRLAQDELYLVSQSVEQLLDLLRTGNKEQVESLLAVTRSGASQDKIMAVVKQHAQESTQSR